MLILKGADINAQNESGKTALMLAAFAGKLNIIKELRSNGASIDHKDKAGCSALHYAVDGGNLEAIQYFLMEGADINAKDNSGWTPLLRSASIGGVKEVAELLCKYKCDVNVLDNEKKSALMIAVINGNQPFVQVLVEHGADLNGLNYFIILIN